MIKRWEYLILRVRADEIISNEAHLNDLGAAGWEMVGVGSFNTANYLYFRRVAVTAGKLGTP